MLMTFFGCVMAWAISADLWASEGIRGGDEDRIADPYLLFFNVSGNV
jgi:hypothetical protein